MAKLPYPPAPELGWYSDDPVEGTPDSAVGTAEPQNDYGQPSTAEAATNTAFTAEPAATAASDGPLLLRRFIVAPQSALVGKTLAGSAIREQFHCMVVGFEHDDTGTIDTATAGRIFRSGDTVWLVGTDQGLTALRRALRPGE